VVFSARLVRPNYRMTTEESGTGIDSIEGEPARHELELSKTAVESRTTSSGADLARTLAASVTWIHRGDTHYEEDRYRCRALPHRPRRLVLDL